MAERKEVFQWKTATSVPRDSFFNAIVTNDELSKTDLRVFLFLLTKLNGYDYRINSKTDPLNYTLIDVNAIADSLDIGKRKVKESISNLQDMGIIECGSSPTINDGYRFIF